MPATIAVSWSRTTFVKAYEAHQKPSSPPAVNKPYAKASKKLTERRKIKHL
jgi:hypothetical protein